MKCRAVLVGWMVSWFMAATVALSDEKPADTSFRVHLQCAPGKINPTLGVFTKSKKKLLDASDLSLLKMDMKGNVRLTFTPEGARKFTAATQSQLGRPLLIMVGGGILKEAPVAQVIHRNELLFELDLKKHSFRDLCSP